jgi:hypothetical protein
MKTIASFLLIALLVSSNGCMTYYATQAAKGDTSSALVPSGNLEVMDHKSHPGYYFLIPLTVPADIATSPFQLLYFGLMEFAFANGHT